ncbi:MAG: hypothetical protein ACI89J_001265 [Hyphomicrobiaceae bacterium]
MGDRHIRNFCIVTSTLSLLLISTQGADAAYRKCGFGIWDEGQKCQRGPLICQRMKLAELDSGTKQWKCWHHKGLKWRPNKKAKMREYHWF